ncbi:transmembrane protein 212 isoform X1 [Acipenser oxyrinchus oxyrinchus]|uniref:Transmembrane protein 212 isoform X1 n=1 Tax=Acipenser oxyrinchus oxyrinchus TaxID=40147 RepID=A0AAD8D547_ACIOX|nr:transmembrane protein 212 isoform X1 [Acipenser oxyrinchus oxyrinchus]
MGAMYRCIGGTLLAFGLLSFFSGVTAFFPVFSYKPWYIGWSVKIATPIWNGVLAIITGTCVLLVYREQTKRSLWEVSYTFAIMCTMFSPVQFAIAIASILIGPYCYYAFAGAVGTNYLGYAVELPFPYAKFQNVCQDPVFYQWYHLGLQLLDLVTSVIIFCLSLTFIIRLTMRLHQNGNLNKTRHGW